MRIPFASMTQCKSEKQLSDFIGDWLIDRDVRPARGPKAHFKGRATWQSVTGGALYIETGQLHLPGQGAFEAERSYRWDDKLQVFFQDGRFFHAVPAQGGDSAHWCDPDQYDASYDFSDWPQWSCRWRVRGPRKEYDMVSRYYPVGGSTDPVAGVGGFK